MGDLQRYIQQRKLKDSVFAEDFEAGYESFKAEILRAMNPVRASSTPILKRSCSIAMSTGNGSRIGSLKNRTQVQSPKAGRYVERDTTTGQFINQKSDDKPFKGVAKEQGRRSK